MESKIVNAIDEVRNKQQTFVLCRQIKHLLSDVIIYSRGINDVDKEELTKARALIGRLQDEALKATMLGSLKNKYKL